MQLLQPTRCSTGYLALPSTPGDGDTTVNQVSDWCRNPTSRSGPENAIVTSVTKISVCWTLNLYTGCPRRNVPDFGSVPYVKVYRYNPKHLYPKLNGYGDNGQRKVGASCGSKYCNLHSWCVTRALMTLRVECSVNRAYVTFSCLHGSWKRHVKCLEP